MNSFSSPACRRLAPLIFGLALLSAPPLFAATEAETVDALALRRLSLEDLMQIKVDTVYGASKHEQRTAEAPSSVSIVTAADIKTFGYRTLGEVLGGVRGFYSTYDRIYPYVGGRGVNRPGDFSGRILVAVNGHRINDPVFDAAMLGTEFPLDLDMIERVEVIRGPGSALYGNNAFFAVVNVVTRTGQGINGVELSGSAGSYDAYSGRFTYGTHTAGGVDVAISGTYLDIGGHDRLRFDDPYGGYVADDLDHDRSPKAWLSVAYKGLTLEGGYVDHLKDIPAAPFGFVPNARPAESIDRRGFAQLRYEHTFGDDWEFNARLHGNHYVSGTHGWYDGMLFGLEPGSALRIENLGTFTWWGGEARLSKTFFEDHRVTLGAEFQDDRSIRAEFTIKDPPLGVTEQEFSKNSFGFYLQDEYAILTNLTLNVGGRFDHYSEAGDTANPRLGLIYNPWPTTTLKLLYGSAYRAPNVYEADFTLGAYLANPDLAPEQIHTYELVWEQGLTKGLRLTTALFYNDLDDLITQVQEPLDETTTVYTYRNVDSATVQGVEAELEQTWECGVRARLSYTFTDATDGLTHRRLDNSPEHVGQAQLLVPLWANKLYAGLEAQVLSERRTLWGNSVPGYGTANATLYSRELIKNLELSVSVYNLFDQRHDDPVGPDFRQAAIEQDGRTFRVKATYRF